MRRFESELASGLKLAGHIRLKAESEYWQMVLKLYGMLSVLATRDPLLAAELAPAQKRMARRSKEEPAEASEPTEE